MSISKTGISPHQQIKAEHLTRIIDALSGDTYTQIEISGSLSVTNGITGSFMGDGSQITNIPNVVTLTGNQTIEGTKTFASDIRVNGVTIGRGGGNYIVNTAIGSQALSNNSNGFNNIGLGYQALSNNSNGFNNIGLGYQALSNNSIGSNNIGLGYQARNVTSSDSHSIIIGNNAVSLGSFSTVIGTDVTQRSRIWGRFLSGTSVDDGSNQGQFNGTVTFHAGTTANQGVIKSQLDLKADLASPTFTGVITTPELTISTNLPLVTTEPYSLLVRFGLTGEVRRISSGFYARTDSPTFTGVPNVPTAASGTNTTQIATTAFVLANSRPYKVYTALLTRTGAVAPNAIILENTLGTITFGYTLQGIYTVISSNLFTLNKTVVFIQNQPTGAFGVTLGASRITSSDIQIIQSTSAGTSDNDWGFPVSIEIRVYN